MVGCFTGAQRQYRSLRWVDDLIMATPDLQRMLEPDKAHMVNDVISTAVRWLL
jgi:hypothetical protein